jgi:hypothetical protein
MKKIRIVLASIALSATLGGCGIGRAIQEDLQADMRRETAIAVRDNVAPEQVAVSGSSFDHGTWRWHAQAAGGDYDCSGVVTAQSDGLAKTVCVRK